MKASTAASSETSATTARIPGRSMLIVATASEETSQTNTDAPSSANSSAIARPMPAAPAVTITRNPLTPASIRRMLEQHDLAGGGLGCLVEIVC